MNKQTEALWKAFGEQIHQDFIDEYGSLAVGLECLIGYLDDEDIGRLRNILENLLSPGMSRNVMHKAWINSGACWVPPSDQIEEFLSGVLKIVKKVSTNKGDGG